MSYNISWYVENRVLLIEISGTLDLENFEQLHSEAFDYVAKSVHKVHAIADISEFEAAPTNNLRILTSASHKEKTDRQGMTILVSQNMPKMLNFLVTVMLQTLRLEYRICETRDEAIQVLERIDPDLHKTTV